MIRDEQENLKCILHKEEMNMTVATIQVHPQGTFALPTDITQRYNIQTGDRFHLVDLEGILVLTPFKPMVPNLSQDIERARIEAGLTIEELLISLRKQRERYVAEKYGIPTS
jgi:bifunctional DNA-binding transcriptional regulator/antitoxin component of YhaV-PrlF toxin-antitoxin module